MFFHNTLESPHKNKSVKRDACHIFSLIVQRGVKKKVLLCQQNPRKAALLTEQPRSQTLSQIFIQCVTQT